MKSNLWIILKKELKELFRDKKSLAMMLVIPIFIPFLILMMSFLFEAQTTTDISEYNKIGFAYELSETETQLLEEMKIEAYSGSEEEMQEAYDRNEIYLYVTKENTNYTIHSNSSEESMYASTFMEQYFESYKSLLQQNYLMNEGIDASEVLNIITVHEEVAEEDFYFANYIKNYAFLFVIMAITVSATYPATDTTAGEKERGTIATLLVTPIKRSELAIGKITSLSVIAVLCAISSFIGTIASLPKMIGMEGGQMTISYQFGHYIALLLIIISTVLVMIGLISIISAFAKSVKEATTLVTPLMILVMVVGIIAMFSEATQVGSFWMYLIPIYNSLKVMGNVFSFHLPLVPILLTILSNIVFSVIFVYLLTKMFNSERVMFSR